MAQSNQRVKKGPRFSGEWQSILGDMKVSVDTVIKSGEGV